MSEFSIIQKYCQSVGVAHPETILSVGDDAAVLRVPTDQELVVSVDTLVAGVHFPDNTKAEHIAHKLLAVNLSDMAAMGAIPKWATIALTLPSPDNDWVASFSNKMNQLATQFDVEVIGGDTTQGPLCLTMQIMGLVPQQQKLTRAGAQIGDDVYVTHVLGDAALGLQALLDDSFAYQLDTQPLIDALNMPVPRVNIGCALRNKVNSCIDISDGLVADLQHIADMSQVRIDIQLERLPLSEQYQAYLQQGGDYKLALGGGDDYELAFTAPTSQRAFIAELEQQSEVRITRIGEVVAGQASVDLSLDQQPYQLEQVGFQHFS